MSDITILEEKEDKQQIAELRSDIAAIREKANFSHDVIQRSLQAVYIPDPVGDTSFPGVIPLLARTDHRHKGVSFLTNSKGEEFTGGDADVAVHEGLPGRLTDAIITGLWTFDRDPLAPFAVTPDSAYVPNLDADMLDGYHAIAFPRKAEDATITGSWDFTANIMMGDASRIYFEAVGVTEGTESIYSSANGIINYLALTEHHFNSSINCIGAQISLDPGAGTATYHQTCHGDTYPFFYMERADAVGFTDRQWGYVVGNGGEFIFQDATASSNRFVIDINGIFSVAVHYSSSAVFEVLSFQVDDVAHIASIWTRAAGAGNVAPLIRIGSNAATTSHGLGSNDVLVAGVLEINGITYHDANAYVPTGGMVGTTTVGWTYTDAITQITATGGDVMMGAASRIYFEGVGTTKDTEFIYSSANAVLNYGAGTHAFAGAVTMDTSLALSAGNIDIPTTSATVGQITQNGGTRILHTYGTQNFFAGTSAGNFTTTGAGRNVGAGTNALISLTSGIRNTVGGAFAGDAITSGDHNAVWGHNALGAVTTTDGSSAFGGGSLQLATGKGNSGFGRLAGSNITTTDYGVFLGYAAGRYETAGSKLYIDNAPRADEADGRVKALIYGVFAATTAAQYLTVNAHLYAREDSLMIGTSKWQFNTSAFWLNSDGTDLVATSSGDFNVACAAQRTLELQTPVWEDIQFHMSTGALRGANQPSWSVFTTNTYAYQFAVDDIIDLEAQELNHKWKVGGTGHFHVHLVLDAASAGATRYAKFEVYVAYPDGTTGVYGETTLTAELTIPASSSAKKEFFLDMGDVTFTDRALDTEVVVSFKRIAATTGTDYADEIFALQCGCHIEQNTLGSRQENVK